MNFELTEEYESASRISFGGVVEDIPISRTQKVSFEIESSSFPNLDMSRYLEIDVYGKRLKVLITERRIHQVSLTHSIASYEGVVVEEPEPEESELESAVRAATSTCPTCNRPMGDDDVN
jgi:hypothetical protein